MTEPSLYAITVYLEEYVADDDPGVTEAEWEAESHRRLVIEAPLEENGQHTPQAVRASRHWCADVLARASLAMVGHLDYAATAEEYPHRCSSRGRWETCGFWYEDGVVHPWDEGSPRVIFVVPKEYRTFWLARATDDVTRALATTQPVPEPSAAAAVNTHAATPTVRTTGQKADQP